jgi:hypothetical protein
VLALILMLPGGLARLMYGGRDLLARALTGIEVRPKIEQDSLEVPSLMAER